jgi:hypothetical protein
VDNHSLGTASEQVLLSFPTLLFPYLLHKKFYLCLLAFQPIESAIVRLKFYKMRIVQSHSLMPDLQTQMELSGYEPFDDSAGIYLGYYSTLDNHS